ncbi:MAG: hypothetical protein ABI912_05340 [Actinomycetota bacterium]
MEKSSRNAEPPQVSDAFAHLTLAGLRSYRKALAQEESRVSYWRRILQARLDMVRANDAGQRGNMDNLRPVLTNARVGSGRTALIDVLPVEDIPPLPDLEELWDRHVRPNDPAYNDDLIEQLSTAESQLSAYRSALHSRIQASTNELIARYRADPVQCLSVLPLPPRRRAVQA